MRGSNFLKLAASIGVLTSFGLMGLSQEAKDPKKEPAVKKVEVGKNVYIEIENKKTQRVIVDAAVCLREGILEHLVTRKNCKEHEAILVADIDARALHMALLLAGAAPGQPADLRRKVPVPPQGASIKIDVSYFNAAGKVVRHPAQEWIRHIKSKKTLHTDWVFAGSRFDVHPNDVGKVHYFANDGDVICVSNFEAALLDLPILSSANDNEFETHKERIPPVGTSVRVILEPVTAKKKQP